MTNDRPIASDFQRAADRQAHDCARLSSEQRADLARRLRDIHARSLEAIERTRKEQALRREDDLARARQRIASDRPQPDYRPKFKPHANRLDRDRIEELTVQEVDSAGALEIARLRAASRSEVSAEIESFINGYSRSSQTDGAIDLLRVHWSEVSGITRSIDRADSNGRGSPPGGRGRE